MIGRLILILQITFFACLAAYGQDDQCVVIPGGIYRSINEYSSDEPYDEPSRTLEITTFTLACFPVTFKEYLTFINDTQTSKDYAFCHFLPEFPVYFDKGVAHGKPGIELCPVYNVTWGGAMKFLEWKSGKDPQNFYRLPTLFEMEYAASNGGETRYPWGNRDSIPVVGNAKRNKKTYVMKLPVGSLQGNKNKWGVYDLIGSVDQWTADTYHKRKFYQFASTPPVFDNNYGRGPCVITFGGMSVPVAASWWSIAGGTDGLPTAYSCWRNLKNNSDPCRQGFRWVRELKNIRN